jgi:hypothetical protein
MLNEIVRDLHKRIEELRPASEEFSELLLAAEEFKKLGVEPASDPIEPVVANTLIYNTRYKPSNSTRMAHGLAGPISARVTRATDSSSTSPTKQQRASGSARNFAHE